MQDVYVHPNALKHGLSENEIVFAWENFIRKQHRSGASGDQVIAVGADQKGRLVELVGVDKPFGVLIYHAMTPPTAKMLLELGMARR